jgi:SNF2 family DNA or RNA helicase
MEQPRRPRRHDLRHPQPGRPHLAAVAWDKVVVDEAQAIKNPRAVRSEAAATVGAHARQRLGITGTPIENHQDELWSILEFLNPGAVGSRDAFSALAAAAAGGDPAASSGVFGALRSVMLRRTKTEVAPDLPDRTEIDDFCELTVQQITLYNAAVDSLLEAHERRDSAVVQMAAITRLKQICDHPALAAPGQFDPAESGKVVRLLHILDQVRAVDERALVFTQYVKMAVPLQRIVSEHLAAPVEVFHGGLGPSERQSLIDRFQDGGIAVLIISLRAGGAGITLTRANHVIHFDRWWNPAVENQASDRAHRIGQTRNVQIHRMICTGSLEERIADLLAHKQALASSLILPSGDLNVTGMTTIELRDLITLTT